MSAGAVNDAHITVKDFKSWRNIRGKNFLYLQKANKVSLVRAGDEFLPKNYYPIGGFLLDGEFGTPLFLVFPPYGTVTTFFRRQVQQLQQRLERGKAPEHEVYDHVSKHDLSENGEDVNPFHRTSIFSADSPPRHYRKDRDFGCKIKIPDFEGKHDVDELIDWLNTIERFFELKDVSDNQKDKMKKALKKKFLPENYCQDVFLKFHSFKQNNLSVVDYTAEFEDLMLRCDIYEPEEQTIARYLGGLRIEICNVVQLQPYWTFHDVCKLALKVEKQLKDSKIGGFRFNQQEGTTNRIGSSTTKVSTPTTQVTKSTKGETNTVGSSHPNTSNAHRKCFKCQGFGHIASDCPNRKIVSLMEEDILEEAEEEPIYDEGHEEDIIYEDHGEALGLQGWNVLLNLLKGRETLFFLNLNLIKLCMNLVNLML
ncbi:hypothetical protein ACH5RR_014702 [Cinchona calisaya]|uniref:CCHC-type domain-containing protein n=1 Tax=Cinchona calisaya TaxID=153742 RepID=A0ABD2ZWB3_9GENT